MQKRRPNLQQKTKLPNTHHKGKSANGQPTTTSRTTCYSKLHHRIHRQVSSPPPHKQKFTAHIGKAENPPCKNKNRISTHTPHEVTYRTSNGHRPKNPKNCRTNYLSRRRNPRNPNQAKQRGHKYIKPCRTEHSISHLRRHRSITGSTLPNSDYSPATRRVVLRVREESSSCTKATPGREESEKRAVDSPEKAAPEVVRAAPTQTEGSPAFTTDAPEAASVAETHATGRKRQTPLDQEKAKKLKPTAEDPASKTLPNPRETHSAANSGVPEKGESHKRKSTSAVTVAPEAPAWRPTTPEETTPARPRDGARGTTARASIENKKPGEEGSGSEVLTGGRQPQHTPNKRFRPKHNAEQDPLERDTTQPRHIARNNSEKYSGETENRRGERVAKPNDNTPKVSASS